MNRPVLLLTLWLLAEMIFGAIDRALAPYEAAFFTWGGVVVLSLLLGLALIERRRNTGPARRG